MKLYGQSQLQVVSQAGANYNLSTGTVKLSLHTSTYVPSMDNDDFFNDATNEISGANGYAAQTLGTKAITYDSTSDQVRFDCADVTFSFTGANTWRIGVVWIDTAGASTTDPVYGYLDFGTDQTVSTTYTLQIDPAGLFFWDVT